MFAFTLLQLPLKAQFPPNWHLNTHFSTGTPTVDWRPEIIRSGLRTRFITSTLAAPFDHCWASVGYSFSNPSGIPILTDMERLTAHDADGSEIINTATGYTADLSNYYRSFGFAIAERRHALGFGYATGGSLRSLGGAHTSGPLDGYVGLYNSDGTFQTGARLQTTGTDNVTDVLFAECVTCSEPWAVYACGNSEIGGMKMPFVTVINANTGALEWTKHFKFSFAGVPCDVEITSITELGSGRFALVGNLKDPITLLHDGVVFVINGSGSLGWVQKYGDSSFDEQFRSVSYTQDSPTTITCVGSSNDAGIDKLWMAEINIRTGVMYNSKKITYNGVIIDPSSTGNLNLEGIDVKKVIHKGLYIVSCKTEVDGLPGDNFNSVYIVDKEFNPLEFIILNRVDGAAMSGYFNSGVDYAEYPSGLWAFATFSNLVGVFGDRPAQGSIFQSSENQQLCNYTYATLLEQVDYPAAQETGVAVESSSMLATELKGVQFNMSAVNDCVPFRLSSQIPSKNLISIRPNPATQHVTIEANKEIATIKVVNTLGVGVDTQKCNGAKNITFPIETLANGTYFLQILYTDGDTANEKVSKY